MQAAIKPYQSLFFKASFTMKIMRIISIFTFFSIVVSFQSCSTSSVETDYLIFGHFYGECVGEGCIEIFKLTDTVLYEDSNDIYPNPANQSYDGNFKALSNEKFVLVRELKNNFPDELLDEKDSVIGQPDAGDWGGLYVEVVENGTKRAWNIDTMKDNVPSKYHTFVDQIQEKIALINK